MSPFVNRWHCWTSQQWRLKVYLMPNDPEALLARVARDFPEATRLKEGRVP